MEFALTVIVGYLLFLIAKWSFQAATGTHTMLHTVLDYVFPSFMVFLSILFLLIYFPVDGTIEDISADEYKYMKTGEAVVFAYGDNHTMEKTPYIYNNVSDSSKIDVELLRVFNIGERELFSILTVDRALTEKE